MYNYKYLDNHIGDLGIKCFSNNLKYITYLEDLLINSIIIILLVNTIENDGIIELSKNIKYIRNLSVLFISWNHITNDGIINISNNLKFVTNMKKLDISCNKFNKDGVLKFSKNIKYLSNLIELDVSSIIIIN